jgi:hypothetical protein
VVTPAGLKFMKLKLLCLFSLASCSLLAQPTVPTPTFPYVGQESAYFRGLKTVTSASDFRAALSIPSVTVTGGRIPVAIGTTAFANSIISQSTSNLVIDAGVLTTSYPITISQYWNNTNTAFEGLKIYIVDTMSTNGSLPFVVYGKNGTTLLFGVDRDGSVGVRSNLWVDGSAAVVGNATVSGLLFGDVVQANRYYSANTNAGLSFTYTNEIAGVTTNEIVVENGLIVTNRVL